jgi:hypothetical protein
MNTSAGTNGIGLVMGGLLRNGSVNGSRIAARIRCTSGPDAA